MYLLSPQELQNYTVICQYRKRAWKIWEKSKSKKQRKLAMDVWKKASIAKMTIEERVTARYIKKYTINK